MKSMGWMPTTKGSTVVVTVVRRKFRDIVAIELQAEVTSSAVGTLVPFSYNRSRPLYLGQCPKKKIIKAK